jgi:type IV pilus assembly protein PilP
VKREDLAQLLAYIGISLVSVGLAFSVSTRFLGVSRAQTPPPPPEATPSGQTATDQVHEPLTTMQANTGISELEGFLEPFIYDIVNRRDPFQAYSEFVPGDENGPSRPLSPAQRFDLEQLQLIGIMWDIKDPKAMFVDPEKEVLVLGRDSRG